MIKAHQLVPYDNATKKLQQVTDLLASVNVAGLDGEHVKMLHDVYKLAVELRHELFSQAHGRFLAERAGEVKPGE